MAFLPEYLGFNMNFEVDDEIDKFVNASKSAETTRKNGTWAKKLENFMKESSVIGQNIEEATQEDINRLLCAFMHLWYHKNAHGPKSDTTLASIVNLAGRKLIPESRANT